MTIIENCAKEPHIVDLANFLNAMGAQIPPGATAAEDPAGRGGLPPRAAVPSFSFPIRAEQSGGGPGPVGPGVADRECHSEASRLHHRKAARDRRGHHGI